MDSHRPGVGIAEAQVDVMLRHSRVAAGCDVGRSENMGVPLDDGQSGQERRVVEGRGRLADATVRLYEKVAPGAIRTPFSARAARRAL